MKFVCASGWRPSGAYVKESVPDMALIVRVAGNDFVPGCHTNKESRVFARAAQEAGADCINVTGGWHESRVPQITFDLPQAGYTYLARGIKENVDIPVISATGSMTPSSLKKSSRRGSRTSWESQGDLSPTPNSSKKPGKEDPMRFGVAWHATSDVSIMYFERCRWVRGESQGRKGTANRIRTGKGAEKDPDSRGRPGRMRIGGDRGHERTQGHPVRQGRSHRRPGALGRARHRET